MKIGQTKSFTKKEGYIESTFEELLKEKLLYATHSAIYRLYRNREGGVSGKVIYTTEGFPKGYGIAPRGGFRLYKEEELEGKIKEFDLLKECTRECNRREALYAKSHRGKLTWEVCLRIEKEVNAEYGLK